MSPALGVEKAEVAFWSSKGKRSPDRQRLCAGMQFGERRERDEKQTEQSAARWDPQTRHWAVSKGPGKDNQTPGLPGTTAELHGQLLRHLFAFGLRLLVTLPFPSVELSLGPRNTSPSSHKVSKESLLCQNPKANEWHLRNTDKLEVCCAGAGAAKYVSLGETAFGVIMTGTEKDLKNLGCLPTRLEK